MWQLKIKGDKLFKTVQTSKKNFVLIFFIPQARECIETER